MFGNASQAVDTSASFWGRHHSSRSHHSDYAAYQAHDPEQGGQALVFGSDRGDHSQPLYVPSSADFPPEYGLYEEVGMLSDNGTLNMQSHADHGSETDPSAALAPSPMESSSGNETVLSDSISCYSPTSPTYMQQDRPEHVRFGDHPSTHLMTAYFPQSASGSSEYHQRPTYAPHASQFQQVNPHDGPQYSHFPGPPTNFHTPHASSNITNHHRNNVNFVRPPLHGGSGSAPNVLQRLHYDDSMQAPMTNAHGSNFPHQEDQHLRYAAAAPHQRRASEDSYYQPRPPPLSPPQHVPVAPFSSNHADTSNSYSKPLESSHTRGNDNFGSAPSSQRGSAKASRVSRSRQRHLSLNIESKDSTQVGGPYSSQLCQSDSAITPSYSFDADPSLAQSYEIPVAPQFSSQYASQAYSSHGSEERMPPPPKRARNFSRSSSSRKDERIHDPQRKTLVEPSGKRPIVLFQDANTKPVFCEAPTPGAFHPVFFDTATSPYTPLFDGPIIFEDPRYRHLKEFYAEAPSYVSSIPSSPSSDIQQPHFPGHGTHDPAHSDMGPQNVFTYSDPTASSHHDVGVFHGFQSASEGECDDASNFGARYAQKPSFNTPTYEPLNPDQLHVSSPSEFIPTVNPTYIEHVLLDGSSSFTATQSLHSAPSSEPHSYPPSLDPPQSYYSDFKLANLLPSSQATLAKLPPTPPSSSSSSSGSSTSSRPESFVDSPEQVNATKKPSTVKIQAYSLNGQVLSCSEFLSAMQKDRHIPSSTGKKGSPSKNHMELKLYLQRKRLVINVRPPGCNCKHAISFAFPDISALILQGAYTSESEYYKVTKGDTLPKYVALTLAMSRGGEYTYKASQPRASAKRKHHTPIHAGNPNCEGQSDNSSVHFNSSAMAHNHNASSSLEYNTAYGASEGASYEYCLPIDAMTGVESCHQNQSSYDTPSSSYRTSYGTPSNDTSNYGKSRRPDDNCQCCGPSDPSLPYHPAMGVLQQACAHSESCEGLCTDSVFSSAEHHMGERYITLILERNSFATSKSKPCPFARLLLTDPYLAHIARVETGYERIPSPFKNLRITPLALLRDRLLCQLELMHNYLLFYGKSQFSLSMSFDVKHDYNYDLCTSSCCIEPPSRSRQESSRSSAARHLGKKDLRASLRESTVAQTSASQEPKPESPTSSFAFYILDIWRLATFRGDDGLEPREIRYICEAIHLGHSRTISFPRPDPRDKLPFDTKLLPEQLLPEAEWIAQNPHATQSTLTSPHLRNAETNSSYSQAQGWPPYYPTSLARFVFPPSLQFSPLEKELVCPNSSNKKAKDDSTEYGGEEVETERADGHSYTKNNCSRTSLIISKDRLEYIFGDELKRLYDVTPN